MGTNKKGMIVTGMPTKEASPGDIITDAGDLKVSKKAVLQSPVAVTDKIINGNVDPDATQTDPDNVTDEVISGNVFPSANKQGSLQSPGLPVKVTSGSLGPGAGYSGPNWGVDGIAAVSSYSNAPSMSVGGNAGDMLVLVGEADQGSLSFGLERDMVRIAWYTSYGSFCYLGKCAASDSYVSINGTAVDGGAVRLESLSEYY